MNRLIIIGASGHGKVVADIAERNGYTNIVFLDDGDIKKCAGYPVIGTTEDALTLDGDKIVAIGNSLARRRIQSQFNTLSLIHPNAVIGNHVQIGNGTVIMAGAVVNPYSVVGEGCIINTASSVDHDCIIGDYSHIAVGAHICGSVHIGNNTWVGAGATVSNNIGVCNDCIIGAGAVVVEDLQKPGTYVGVPAKLLV